MVAKLGFEPRLSEPRVCARNRQSTLLTPVVPELVGTEVPLCPLASHRYRVPILLRELAGWSSAADVCDPRGQ